MFKISVIVPVYNSREKIRNAFDSIYNQSIGFKNLEVIFIDDSSTDGSQEIIKEYSNKYDNVKGIFLEKNSGYAGKPRNIGIENASAPYLMFLDSDDVYMEYACEVLYENIYENDIDMVSGNYIRCVGDVSHGKNWRNLGIKNNGEVLVDSISQQPEFFNVSQSVWCKIFKRDFILNHDIKFLEGVPAQDVYFVYDALLNANGIKYVDIPVVKYFPGDGINFNSITSKRDKKSLLKYLKTYFKILDLLKTNNEYEKYIAPHLKFFTTQLIVSDMSNSDKLDLLMLAYPLYEVFFNNNLEIKQEFTLFYQKVYEKKFGEAINLIQYIRPSLPENDYRLYEDLKTKEFIIIYKDDEALLNLNQQLKNKHYDVKLIDIEKVDELNNLSENGDKLILKDDLEGLTLEFDTINQFYEYYITDLCLNDEKVFLIIDDGLNVNIESSIAYIADNNMLNDWENYFKELYKLDLIIAYTIILDVKNQGILESNERLLKRNKQLEDINNDLRIKLKNSKNARDYYKKCYNELINSTSWKVTSPLRKIRKL